MHTPILVIHHSHQRDQFFEQSSFASKTCIQKVISQGSFQYTPRIIKIFICHVGDTILLAFIREELLFPFHADVIHSDDIDVAMNMKVTSHDDTMFLIYYDCNALSILRHYLASFVMFMVSLLLSIFKCIAALDRIFKCYGNSIICCYCFTPLQNYGNK